jgi:1-acyl-sn-glycerol-3-phosphate acyltransferase
VADLVYPPVVVAIKGVWKYLGLQFDFQGVENLPREGGAVLCMNHIGYLDFAVVGTAALPTKRYIRFMAKKEIFNHKIAGPLMRGMKHISVDRESGSSSFVAALRALRAGELVGIFPEGTTSRSFEVEDLKSGAVRLSMGAGVPIIPVAIWGTQRIFTKKRKPDFKRRKHPIHVVFGEPYFVPKGSDVDAAEVELKEKMVKLLHSAQSNYPHSHEGQWWAPARLGGTAITSEQLRAERQKLKEQENG